MTTAAVIGSGPNGLAAALTMAAAGVSVTVYEADEVPGGGTRSSELTLPGLLHDECSSHHPFGPASAFAQEFALENHGLEWAFTEVEFAHPLDSGRGAALVRSVFETAKGLGGDAKRYRQVMGPVASRMPTISAEFLQSMIHVPKHPIHLAILGMRAALPAAAIAAMFETEEATALWAGVAAHTFGSFAQPLSSAIGTSLASAAHYYGWPVAVGGSGRIATAVLSALRDHGGAIEVGRRIDDVRELGSPDVLMFDTGPSETLRIAADLLPSHTQRILRRWQPGPAAFKLALAVDGGIPWEYEPATRAGTIHVSGSYKETAAAELATTKGAMPQRPYVLLGQQYLADPSRANGNLVPIDCYAHVPNGYSGDATEAILSQIERFAPGFKERVMAMTPRGTADIERLNPNFAGGDILTGNKDLLQLVLGPRSGLSAYRLGTKGIYQCSAATPPGPGAHGMCGYLAAKKALADL
ncbi:MAG: NAD(P)/FAD-dependent oxidoreductase [Brevibacterium aurantiacum]|nr:NAD(P)/FAD-dependent oxidoreductase [Brevibacterium aurantiacum]MDN5738172.1 NAD(P)/FAD-dependent oxidoreductase [Brevibacterium aurantiacum]MDN5807079.1 NAD(P)/FAD-dependent oxidoreductase [Brevibacterium sp.]MDN6158458.1 NAD(P)/FAD-dependent oxidoreductase [Brevibacterium sp.]